VYDQHQSGKATGWLDAFSRWVLTRFRREDGDRNEHGQVAKGFFRSIGRMT
jgi:hypothetical protein